MRCQESARTRNHDGDSAPQMAQGRSARQPAYLERRAADRQRRGEGVGAGISRQISGKLECERKGGARPHTGNNVFEYGNRFMGQNCTACLQFIVKSRIACRADSIQ